MSRRFMAPFKPRQIRHRLLICCKSSYKTLRRLKEDFINIKALNARSRIFIENTKHFNHLLNLLVADKDRTNVHI